MPFCFLNQQTEYKQQLQMAQHQSSVKGAPPPGLGGFGSKKPKILRLKPSQKQRELEQKKTMNPVARKPDAQNAKQISRIMGFIRTQYDNYYQVNNAQDLELKLQTILNVEKCPLSMVGYDKEDNLEDDANDSLYDNSLGFAILKCRLLGCQHVIRLSALKNETSLKLNTYHAVEYAPISYEDLNQLSYIATMIGTLGTHTPQCIQPRRRFSIDLKFFHLLSDVADTVFVPEHAQSVSDPNTLSEYILLFYDLSVSPWKELDQSGRARYHHVQNGGAPTYLRFARGRVSGTLKDLNSKSQYTLQFTYDLTKVNDAQQEGGSGLVMEHIDQNTNCSFRFYLRKIAVSNTQTKSVNFKYQLVAMKAEFVGKQTTPTLSPTFGGVQV